MAYGSGTTRNYLREYEVGTYRDLQARSVRGDGLDIHHIVQKQIGLDMIPNYSEANGICVALRAGEHRKIPTLRSNEIAQKYHNKNARQILADDVWRNRQSGVIPTSVLLQAIRFHIQLYPQVYEKPGGGNGMRLDARPLLTTLEQAAVSEQQQAAAQQVAQLEQRLHLKAQACLTNGNRLYRLPSNVRQLLQNNGASSSSSSSDSRGDSIVGTYIIHEEYDSGLSRMLTLKVRIEYVECYSEIVFTKREQKG